MTTNGTTGAHRPENLSPTERHEVAVRHRTAFPRHAGVPTAPFAGGGANRAAAWRAQAENARQDLDAARTLRSLRSRGAGA